MLELKHEKFKKTKQNKQQNLQERDVKSFKWKHKHRNVTIAETTKKPKPY